MTAYHVALVRFDGPNQTAYPVNGEEYYDVGSRVLVQMDWANRKLAFAEVVGRSFSKQPCRHSIVCDEGDAPDYGLGPAAIQTRAELDRFMQVFNYAPVAVFSTPWDAEPDYGSDDWSVAYLPREILPLSETDTRKVLSRPTYIIGPAGVGVIPLWNDIGSITVRNGKVVVEKFKARILWDSQIDLHRKCAEFVQGDLFHKVQDQRDDTLGQIRDAIGGDAGGAVYLSDGVWL